MYKVIKHFTDLQDKCHAYNVGDMFPRKGRKASADRLKELSSKDNKRGVSLIEKIDDAKPKSTPKAEGKTSAE